MNTEQMRVPAAGRAFVDFISGKPLISLLLGLLLVMGLGSGLPRISVDFTYRAFFAEDDELMVGLAAFERQFGNDDAVVVAVESPSGIFDPESAMLMRELTQRMWKVPHVIRVESLSAFNWVHAIDDEIIIEPFFPEDGPLTPALLAERKKIALSHETLPDYLVSRDTRTAMLFAYITPDIGEKPIDNLAILAAVREIVRDLEKGDHRIHLTGGPTLSVAFQEAAVADNQNLLPIVLLLVIVLLYVLIRSVAGIFLTLGLVFFSIIGSMGIAGLFGVVISNMTAMLPQIMIAIGVADAVHILVTFYREMRRGTGRIEAARYSLLKNFVPTGLTTLSTAVGFFSFTTSEIEAIRGLGIVAGGGAILAWILTYLMLGALIIMLPLRAKPRSETTWARLTDFVDSYTSLLARFRVPVIIGFAISGVLAAWLSSKIEVNSDPFKYFYEGYPVRVANEYIEEKVGGARGVELVVDSGREEGAKDPAFLAGVDAFQQWIEAQPLVTRTISIVDVLKQTNRSLNGDRQEFYKLPEEAGMLSQELLLYTMGLPQGMDINDRIAIKNDRVRITVLWTIPTSKETVAMIRRIEEKGAEMGLNVTATGKNLLWQSMNEYVVDSFVLSMTTAIVVISLMIMLVFRSLPLGALAMLPNMVPLIIGGAFLWLLGRQLDVGTVLIGAVCLGIAVDDTIHIMSDYSRNRQEGRTTGEAVREVLLNTTPALITTTIILVVAFGTFAFATFVPNIYFGVMTALILTAALLTDLTFLPAMLLVRDDQKKEQKPAGAGPAGS